MTEIQQTNIAVANFIIGDVNNGTGVILEVGNDADLYYHVLSNYIAVHEKLENCIDQFIANGGFDKAFRNVFGRSDDAVNAVRGGK